MVRRTQADALVTRDKILDTAERIFEKKGVSRTTLEDIASAARVTRGAIYGHFRNKNELFVAMFNRVHLPIDSQLLQKTSDCTDPVGHLREQFIAMLIAASSNRRDQRVLTIIHHKCEFTDDMSVVVARYKTMARENGRRLRSILRSAVEQGQLPPRLDVPNAETLFHALLVGIIGNWTLSPRSFPLRREAETLVDAYFDMLRLSRALRS